MQITGFEHLRSETMWCHCGKEAMLLVLGGCFNMHVDEYAFCMEHVSPVRIGPCPEDGGTYCEVLVRYLKDGFETYIPVPRKEGSEAVQFLVNVTGKR